MSTPSSASAAPSASPTDGYVEGPRFAVVTADNVGPVVTIVTLFLMVVMILAVALRLLVRLTTSHVPGIDDAVISLALLMALGEVIAITVTVPRGLGMRLSLLSQKRLDQVQVGLFTGDILYVLTIALAKASTLFLLQRLSRRDRDTLVARIVAAILAVWTITAVFGMAFRCQFPDPWAILGTKCINYVAFWDVLGAIDILLDVVLVIMPITIVWDLKMSLSRKVIVGAGFGCRLILPIAQIFRLAYLQRYDDQKSVLYSSLGFILATQFQTTLAVIIACIPAFKPFMDRVASGLVGISFRERGGTYAMDSINNKRSGTRSKQSSGNGNGSRSRSLAVPLSAGNYHAEIAAAASNSKDSVRTPPRDANAADNAATKTVEWEVHYSDKAKPNHQQAWPAERPSDEREILPGSRGSSARSY